MTAPPHICPSCGQILSTGGGRCPVCGTELPRLAAATAVRPRSPQPLRPAGPTRDRSRSLVGLATGAAVLGVLALLAWRLYPRPVQPRPSPAPVPVTASPPIVPRVGAVDPTLGVGELERVDPALVLLKSGALARDWHRDAALVRFEATPVVSGKVDVTHGGRVTVEYAKPSPAGLLPPGSPVTSARYRIRVDASGPHAQAGTDARAARAVAEPNCTLERARRAMTLAGLPPAAGATLEYAATSDGERALWRATISGKPELTRLIDGESCVVVTAR